jgi:hypothetical protein
MIGVRSSVPRRFCPGSVLLMCELSPLFYQDDQISFFPALLIYLGDPEHSQGVAKWNVIGWNFLRTKRTSRCVRHGHGEDSL